MSNNKKRLIPIRRFNEFKNSDAWEQHKVTELLKKPEFYLDPLIIYIVL